MLSILVAPTIEPVTLEETKAHLRVEHYLEDQKIEGMISAARKMAEQMCDATFAVTQYTLSLDGFDSPMVLPKSPVVSVQSVKYDDSTGVEQTLSTSVYAVDIGEHVGEIRLKYGQSWPAVRSDTNCVRIAYTAGVSSPLVQQFVLKMVEDMYRDAGLSAERAAALNPYSRYLLDAHINWSV